MRLRYRVRALEEISLREIIRESRALCRGYYNWDIAMLVARSLHQEGIRVWR